MPACILTARQRRLLSILDRSGGIVPGRTLAEQLELSTRTIRQTVSELNEMLDPENIRVFAVPGKGYRVEVLNRKAFHELVNDHRHMRSREDRIQYLILTLLEKNDWTPIDDLEEALYVSRTTLENDLKDVRRLIVDSEPYIGLTRRQGRLLFENDEQKRRDILVRIYTERWDYHSREGVAYREGYLDADIIEGIRVELRKLLSETGIALDDYGHVYLLLSCAVLYERNLKGCTITSCTGSSRTEETDAAARLLLERLNKSWEIDIGEGDRLWLSDAIARLRILAFSETQDGPEGPVGHAAPAPEALSASRPGPAGSDSDYDSDSPDDAAQDSIPGSEDVSGCLERYYGMLEEKLPFSLRDDMRLREDLLQQLRAFRNHHISFQASARYELEALAQLYEFLREPALILGRMMQEDTGYQLRDGEELYLLPALSSAVERRERRLRHRLRAVVVSHVNSLMTGYLCENLRKLFGTRIEIAAALPVYDRQAIEAWQPSFIITTVRQQEFRISGVPTVVTSPIVTEEDLLRIDACIQKLERQIR